MPTACRLDGETPLEPRLLVLMERLFLARHAESESGVLGRVNGDLRFPSRLTEEGRAQARTLGRSLAGEEIDLCATSEFPRTIETADLALEGRSVPRLVVPDLNEIGFGAFEGGPLADYRVWAFAHGSAEDGPGGAESRLGTARRFARAFGAAARAGGADDPRRLARARDPLPPERPGRVRRVGAPGRGARRLARGGRRPPGPARGLDGRADVVRRLSPNE